MVFSHQLAQRFPRLDGYGLWQGSIPKLESIEAPDDYRVRFHLSIVDIVAHELISKHPVVPRHRREAIEDPVKGHGQLDHSEVRGQVAAGLGDPFYWEAGKPFVDCLRLRQFQSNDQVHAALMRNELDWGANFKADIERTYVARNPETNHFWYPPNSTVSIHLNTTQQPFDNLKFRQAFSHAINRRQIVELATYGYASLDPHMTGIVDYFKSWYDDAVNR